MLLSDQGMHSAIINELDRPREESAVKNCNKNGIGRMLEVRTKHEDCQTLIKIPENTSDIFKQN